MAIINNNDIDKSRKLVLREIGEKFEEKISNDNGLLDQAINKKAKKIANSPLVKSAVFSGKKINYEKDKQAVKKEIGEDKAPAGNELLDSAIARKAMKISGDIQAKAAGKKINLTEGKKVIENLFNEKTAKRPDKRPLRPKAEKIVQFGGRTINKPKPKLPVNKPLVKAAKEVRAFKEIPPSAKSKESTAPEKENISVFYVIIILAAIVFYFVFFFFQLSWFRE